jgi:hypothetical protein
MPYRGQDGVYAIAVLEMFVRWPTKDLDLGKCSARFRVQLVLSLGIAVNHNPKRKRGTSSSCGPMLTQLLLVLPLAYAAGWDWLILPLAHAAGCDWLVLPLAHAAGWDWLMLPLAYAAGWDIVDSAITVISNLRH